MQLFCLKHNRKTTRLCRGVFFKAARNNLQANPGGHEQFSWDIKMANENICPMSARTRLKIIILDCQIITRSSFASLSDMGLKTFFAYLTPGDDRNNIGAHILFLQGVPKKSSLADRLFRAVG